MKRGRDGAYVSRREQVEVRLERSRFLTRSFISDAWQRLLQDNAVVQECALPRAS